MKVWCMVGQADTWKKPQWEEIGRWHMLKFKRALAGAWPKELPEYLGLTECPTVPPSPYPVYVPGAEGLDGTDFFEDIEEDNDDGSYETS